MDKRKLEDRKFIEKIMKNLIHPRIDTYSGSAPPIVYIGGVKYLYENSAELNLVCVRSEDYQTFSANVVPKLFILDECFVSYDKSWKLNPEDLNNIKHLTNFTHQLLELDCFCVLISRGKGVIELLPDSLKSLFHHFVLLGEVTVPEEKFLLTQILELKSKSLNIVALVDKICS